MQEQGEDAELDWENLTDEELKVKLHLPPEIVINHVGFDAIDELIIRLANHPRPTQELQTPSVYKITDPLI